MSVKIGDVVEYVSTSGKTKVGLVVATEDTLSEGTSLSGSLSSGAVNLTVFSATGKGSARLAVQPESEVEEGTEGGFYRPLD